MSSPYLSPEYLCRITDPRNVALDEEGNFLPHERISIDTYGKSVPLVRLSELGVVVDFFYQIHWNREQVPYFVLLIFQVEKLQSLVNKPTKLLKEHGEYFAIANLNALESALLCKVTTRIESFFRDEIFGFQYTGRKYELPKRL